MKLIVHELKESGVTQVLKPNRNVMVEAVRPHIYRHNLPAGEFFLEILNADEEVIATSAPVLASSIGGNSFFHGYVRFDIKAGLKKNQVYTFRLSATDYEFSESAYIAWVNGFDLGKYPLPNQAATSIQAPLDLEVWERKVR